MSALNIKTYFAYSDQKNNNVYVHNFTTQNYYPVSPYDCSHVHQDCPRLLILDNEYLVVRDANHDLVFDATTNFSLIINILVVSLTFFLFSIATFTVLSLHLLQLFIALQQKFHWRQVYMNYHSELPHSVSYHNLCGACHSKQ